MHEGPIFLKAASLGDMRGNIPVVAKDIVKVRTGGVALFAGLIRAARTFCAVPFRGLRYGKRVKMPGNACGT